MRWVLMEIDSKRIDALAKHRMGWKVAEICRSEGISRMTFYRWLDAYSKHGQKGLVKKSTRPNTIHLKVTSSIAKTIIKIRRKTKANEYAIESKLNAKGIDISHASIYAVLKENGLINGLSRERKQRTYVRYQRDHPNSLWQTDLSNWKERVLIAYIDDYSRFITGFGMFDNGLAVNCIKVFQGAIDAYGKPKEVLSDHGSQFYSMRGDESEFDRFCASHRIKHILGSIGKPTTTGKIERWFGSFKAGIDNFRSVGDYVKYYNYEKPHKSLDYLVPAERYFEKV
jgi:transposase InsO family protein